MDVTQRLELGVSLTVPPADSIHRTGPNSGWILGSEQGDQKSLQTAFD